MSAAERTSASVTCSAKWFQLFQPMGGVAASCWLKAGTEERTAAQVRAARVRIEEILLGNRLQNGLSIPQPNHSGRHDTSDGDQNEPTNKPRLAGRNSRSPILSEVNL